MIEVDSVVISGFSSQRAGLLREGREQEFANKPREGVVNLRRVIGGEELDDERVVPKWFPNWAPSDLQSNPPTRCRKSGFPGQSRDRARTTLSTKPIRRSATRECDWRYGSPSNAARRERTYIPAGVEAGPATSPLHVISRGGHERIVPIGDEFAAELLAGSRVYV